MKLTESAHVKDVVCFMRIVHNPADHLSWNRVLLFLEKVGPKTVQSLLEWLRTVDDPIASLAGYPKAKTWRPGLVALAGMLKEARSLSAPSSIFDLIMQYYQPIFERIYYDDYPRRSRDLEQLGALLAGYQDLGSFIDDAALDPPEVMQDGSRAADMAPGRIVLSTIHSAKGLEWNSVFVIHLAEGKFPSSQSVFQDQIEEERRLFYVSVTRARKKLFLSYPRQTAGVDRKLTYCRISPFLDEIEPGLLAGNRRVDPVPFWKQEVDLDVSRPKRAVDQAARKLPTGADFKVGTAVKHSFFGQGTVEKIISSKTIDVFFPRHGKKTLHLDYAKLEIIAP